MLSPKFDFLHRILYCNCIIPAYATLLNLKRKKKDRYSKERDSSLTATYLSIHFSLMQLLNELQNIEVANPINRGSFNCFITYSSINEFLFESCK